MTRASKDQAFQRKPMDQNVPKGELEVGPDELPPSYVVSESIASGGLSLPPTFKTKPTNFLALATSSSAIRGEFVIDPSIHIPSSMLPPLSEGETEDDRKNLSLDSKYSSVRADVWLLGSHRLDNGETPVVVHKSPSRRTSITLVADHGSIHARLHTFDGAAPFALTARAAHGTIRLALPRSFQGLLLISTCHGNISLSDALVQDATQLSQVHTTHRYFVGDFQALGEESWEGDRVEVEATHGSIRIKYVDEADGLGKEGWLSWLLGKVLC